MTWKGFKRLYLMFSVLVFMFDLLIFSRGAINVVLYKKYFMQISGSDNLIGKQALERNEVNSRNETYLVSN